MKTLVLVTLVLLLGLFIGTSSAVEFTLYGPDQYSRTEGKPTSFHGTFLGTIGEGKLILTNGTADGKNRISSASIFVNGQEVLGPRDFNLEVYHLEVPIEVARNNTILVQLMSEVGSYIMIKITEEVAADTTTTEVIGPEGGSVSVQNHLGDTATLEIPPLALPDSTSISITPLADPPTNLVATNIYPGIILEPSGLTFSTPVKIRVDFQDPLTNPQMATLFWLKDANLLLPIPNQTRTQNSIEGEMHHFSTVIGGEPSQDEIASAIASLGAQWVLSMEYLFDTVDALLGWAELCTDPGCVEAAFAEARYQCQNWAAINFPLILAEPVGSLDEVFAEIDALLEFAYLCNTLGDQDLAQSAIATCRELLESYARKFLSEPVPAEPCGKYSYDASRLAEELSKLGSPLYEEVLKRICTFEVTPDHLFLDMGDTAQLTAKLFDPNGNQHSCTTLGWATSDVHVVEITSTNDGTCVVRAADKEGHATISANCDGLSDLAHIDVKLTVDRLQVNTSTESPIMGSPVQFTVTALDSQGHPVTIPASTITWSRTPAVGSLNPQTGLSTTLLPDQPGSVTVTASYKNGMKTASSTICARYPIATIEVSPSSKSLFIGNTVQLTATAKTASGSTDFGCEFSPHYTWYSSNLNVATVDGSGYVGAVSKGGANISAVYGSKLGYSQITVFDMTGTWLLREIWESSSCPSSYESSICTINQTGNFLGNSCGPAYFTGYFTGPGFNWTLTAPFWLNQYAIVYSSSMTGTVSADGLHYQTYDTWTASYLSENGIWQTCGGFSVYVGDRL